MCKIVEPKWLQYECGHFAIRDNLPWWIEYCVSRHCVYSPFHEVPCYECIETCEQRMSVSLNNIMAGGVNRCSHCERGRRRRPQHRRRRRKRGYK